MNAIERAIFQLERKKLIELVGSEKVHRHTIQFERSGFMLGDFWRHNLAVAFAAYLLTFPLEEDKRTPEQEKRYASFCIGASELDELRRIDLPARLGLDPDTEEPYLAGLIHDVGKAAMVQVHPDLYGLILEETGKRDWAVGMALAERGLTQRIDHCQAGGGQGLELRRRTDPYH